MEIIYNSRGKTILYLIVLTFCTRAKQKSGTASVNKDSQWSKQEACFARETQVCVAVNHTG